MNLLQTIRAIEGVAAAQPTVSTIVRNDVFRLNSCPAAKYGVFAWLQGEHRTTADGSLMQYQFTLFYVDRLTFGKQNEMEVQSVGIETLENILLALESIGITSEEHTFRTFNQRFSDECAGVFCNVTLEVPKDTLCEEAFDFLENIGDFNIDFNDDFNVWIWHTKEREIIIV